MTEGHLKAVPVPDTAATGSANVEIAGSASGIVQSDTSQPGVSETATPSSVPRPACHRVDRGPGQTAETCGSALRWTRSTPFGVPDFGEVYSAPRQEIWQCSDDTGAVESFEVAVKCGKPLDVLSLKDTSLDEIREYAEFLQNTALKLYANKRPRKTIDRCPCCDAEARHAVEVFRAFDIPYHRCAACGHVFVLHQPDSASLSEVFADSVQHSATYTDQHSLEVRLQEVVQPKLEWVCQTYQRHYGRGIASALDVGAGGGHFVEVCRRSAIRADGYEISRSSRDFAHRAFQIDLRSEDALSDNVRGERFDLVTLWGLLEYTPEPRKFLEASRQRLDSHGGLLVVEVPRFDCLGTAIQKICHRGIARHMDPTSHVNCFSDQSLLTSLYLSGFQPVAAWYFGMDMYELLVQTALKLNDESLLHQTCEWISPLQQSLDSACLCDDLIVAAIPRSC